MTDAERARINENSALRAQIAEAERRIKAMTREQTSAELDDLSAATFRADAVARLYGTSASRPVPGEAPLQYRKRLARQFQPHSAKFKEARLDSLDAATFSPVEQAIYADARAAAFDPNNHPPGRLTPLTEIDSSGRTITTFVGDPLTWMSAYMGQGAAGTINRNPPRGR